MLRLTFFLAMMFTILVASIFRTPMIVFMAALMCATLVTGLILGRRANQGLVVTRTMPEVGMVGDVVSGRITVLNQSKWPNFFVHLQVGQVTSPHGEVTTDGKRLEEETSNGAGPSWPVAAIGSSEHTIPLLRPDETITWEPQWRLQRRGVYRLPPVRAGSGDPLGMFNALQPHTGTPTITVLPRPIKLHRLGFLGGVDVGLRAPQHATAVTEAMDFHGIRLWHPGEGMRRVHWKSTARTGNIHVVEWEENLATDLTVLLDTQVTTAHNSTLHDGIDEAWESAIVLTASIADYLLENGFRFELFCWQRPLTNSLPVSSTSNTAGDAVESAPKSHDADSIQLCYHRAYNANGIGETLKMLAQIEPLTEDTATLSSLARRAAPRIERGGSVVIISTTRADVAGALQTLESSAPRGTSGYAVVLDAESFDAAPDGAPAQRNGYRTRARHARHAPAEASSSVSAFAPTAAMRLVRRGDSLADALELA